MISKDADFRDSYYLNKTPLKLVKVNLGNISNLKLMNIIDTNLDKIEKLNSNGSFILEINDDDLTFSSMKIII